MPLSLLLDENISPVVARQVRAKRPDIAVASIHEWRDGAYLSAADELVLAAAHVEGRTLVTYDVRILSHLAWWFEAGEPFSGLVFVDEKTIPGSDFGGLVRALTRLWDRESGADWLCRLVFLEAE